jgi:hypothetical protein
MVEKIKKNANPLYLLKSSASIKEIEKQFEGIFQRMEPCESGIGSAYIDCNGIYHHCSFQESMFGVDIFSLKSFNYFWTTSKEMISWRQKLKLFNRSCPIYDV